MIAANTFCNSITRKLPRMKIVGDARRRAHDRAGFWRFRCRYDDFL